jgi:hypothetical protein
MWVRLLSGRYAGEERDVRADQAKAMLADGRAELPAYVGGGKPEIKQPLFPALHVAPKKRGRNG